MFPQASASIGNHGVLVEINLLIFDRSPEAFDKDVVIYSAPAIHTCGKEPDPTAWQEKFLAIP